MTGLRVTSVSRVEKLPKASFWNMFCQSTKALGLLIFSAEATMICESPQATRCRNWS